MLLRSTLIFAPAVLLIRLSSLVVLVVATRLLAPVEYGLLTLVVSIGEMADMALSGWLRVAFLRLGGGHEVTRGSVAKALHVLVATTVLAVIAGIGLGVATVPERADAFALAVLTYLVAGSIGRFLLTLLQMRGAQLAYTSVETLRAALQIILPLGVMLLGGRDFLAVSLAGSAAAVLAAALAFWLNRGQVKAGPAAFSYRALLGFGLPLLVVALVGFGLNNAERIVLKIAHDASAVALFAATYALARQPIDMIGNAVNMGGFPAFIALYDREGKAAAAASLTQQCALILSLALPVAALLSALAPDVTALVLPAAYQGGTDLLFPLIGLAVIFTNLKTFVFDNVVHAHKRPWLMVLSLAPGSVVTILLSIALVPPLSAVGAALALAGGAGVSLGLSMWVAYRLLPISFPWRAFGIAVAASLGAAGAARLTLHFVADVGPLWRLLLGGGAGATVLLIVVIMLSPATLRSAWRKFRSRLAV